MQAKGKGNQMRGIWSDRIRTNVKEQVTFVAGEDRGKGGGVWGFKTLNIFELRMVGLEDDFRTFVT
jgi:hypothetical protein